MKGRHTVNSIFFDPTQGLPGPGAYESNKASDNKLGKVFSSRQKSPGSAVINLSGKKLDDSEIRNKAYVPGPGSYKAASSLNSTGQNFFRNFRSSGAPVFGRSDRRIDMETSATRKITPGPGSY